MEKIERRGSRCPSGLPVESLFIFTEANEIMRNIFSACVSEVKSAEKSHIRSFFPKNSRKLKVPENDKNETQTQKRNTFHVFVKFNFN